MMWTAVILYLIFAFMFVAWMFWEANRAPFMDDQGRYTDADGNLLKRVYPEIINDKADPDGHRRTDAGVCAPGCPKCADDTR